MSIPIEEIAKFPPPGMSTPVMFAFSPDDRLLTYLYGEDQSPIRQLYALDTDTGESRVIQVGGEPESTELTLEEQLLRQRQRQLGQGIVRYVWAEDGDLILIPAQSGAYVKEGADSPARPVISADEGPVLNPTLSPDGSMIAFVRDAEIYIVPVEGGAPTQITSGARGTGKTHGLAEYIAQEEMHRLTGLWWSKDSRHVAFEEVDETHIPVYRIMHQGKDEDGRSRPGRSRLSRSLAWRTPASGWASFLSKTATPYGWTSVMTPTSTSPVSTGCPTARSVPRYRTESRTRLDLHLLRPINTGQPDNPANRVQRRLDKPERYVPPPCRRQLHMGLGAYRLQSPLPVRLRRKSCASTHFGRMAGGLHCGH